MAIMSKNECPICGRTFDDEVGTYLDNGSPACPECVEKENLSF